jgi:hypothetical protein
VAPPPDPLPLVGKGKGGKGHGKAVPLPDENKIDLACGTIKHYAPSKRFIAQCRHCGACYRSRVAYAGVKPGQGRPLGFLASWLLYPELLGGLDACTTEAHLEAGSKEADFDEEMRTLARDELSEVPGAIHGLFRHEAGYDELGPLAEPPAFK